MKIKINRGSPGSVLLVTLLSSVVIGLALASYLWLVSNQNLSNVRSQVWNSGMPLAEAGVEEALTQLRFNDLNHLSANGWTVQANGWYSKQRHLDSRSYYEVSINPVDPPIIVSTGYLPSPLASPSSFAMMFGSVAQTTGVASYVKRRVKVNTVRKSLFPYGMVAKGQIDMSGNNITTDGFNSTDPNYSTLGKYVGGTKILPSGDMRTNSRLPGAISVGNADFKGSIGTGAGGTSVIGSNGTVGDLAWVDANTAGIKPGWNSDDTNIQIDDVEAPFATGFTPIPVKIGNDTYTYLDGTLIQNYKASSLGGTVYVTGNVTIWVTDTLSITGSESIQIAPGATLKIYCSAASAVIGGNGVVNSDGFATSFQYYGLPSNTSVTLSGNGAFVGTIYAPQAALSLGGGGNNSYDFVGSAVINTVKVNGHFNFHYDEALRGQLTQGYMASAWNETDPNAPIN